MNTPYRHNGFTLLEVLMALVVLSIGLLGLASLQANALRFNYQAYLRSQATTLAYDMSDRIRVNWSGADNTPTSDYDIALGDATPVTVDCSCGCTAAQMAQFDHNQWLTDISTLLPAGDGSIARTNINPSRFTITVSWQERVSQEESATGLAAQTISIQVQP